jgi:hypothetical protein
MRLPAGWVLALAFIVAVVAGAAYMRANERRVGALTTKLAVADSVHRADSIGAVTALAVARRAALYAVALRVASEAAAHRDTAAHQHTDSVLRATALERDRARALLSDSGATASVLRGEVARLLDTHRVDSLAWARERAQHDSTVGALRRAIAAADTARYKDAEAARRLTERAIGAERQTALLREQRGSWFARLLTRCGVSAGYAITFAGQVSAGPGALAGCRLLP